MAAGKGGVERSGVSVIVPTTAGSIQVLGLRWSQRVAQSRVVLGNETSTPCERWTKDYHSLLTPGDPMRTLLGLPEGGGCRLVVSAEIDLGRSWIVPIAAAHFADARAQAIHADIPRARMLIWGTGAIDFSQPETADQAKIVPNDYHLTSKIDLAREHFAAAAHEKTPVLALLPAGGDAERAAGILRKVLGQQPHHIEIVSTLADVIRPIDAYLRKGDFAAPPEMKYAPVPYTPPPEIEDEPVVVKAAPTEAPPAPKRETSPPPPPRSAPAEPPPPLRGGLAGDPVAPPVRKSGGGIPVGVLGGVAVALIAVIGVGAMMLRQPTLPEPQQRPATQPTPAPQPVRPQPVVIAPATPPAQAPASAAPPPAVVVTAPPAQSTTPAPALSPPPVPAANPPAATLPAPVAPAGDASQPVGRLTILTPPTGSSCQDQVLAMNPRFVETVIELSAAQPLLEIDTPAICGLAIAGSGAAQSRFAPGTVTGTVGSLSSVARIVFNPGNAGGRLPDIAVTGGSVEKIELRRK